MRRGETATGRGVDPESSGLRVTSGGIGEAGPRLPKAPGPSLSARSASSARFIDGSPSARMCVATALHAAHATARIPATLVPGGPFAKFFRLPHGAAAHACGRAPPAHTSARGYLSPWSARCSTVPRRAWSPRGRAGAHAGAVPRGGPSRNVTVRGGRTRSGRVGGEARWPAGRASGGPEGASPRARTARGPVPEVRCPYVHGPRGPTGQGPHPPAGQAGRGPRERTDVQAGVSAWRRRRVPRCPNPARPPRRCCRPARRPPSPSSH